METTQAVAAPPHARVVTVAGTFAALVDGPADAPVVILQHGFPDVPLGWRGVVPALVARGYRVVAPYLRGYDPSTLAGPYHWDRIADDLIALADALSPDHAVHLVGHDWGALGAVAALSRSPGRFARAVVMSVPHPSALVANIRDVPDQLRRSWYMGFLALGRRTQAWATDNDFELVERLWSTWSPGFRPPADYLEELKRCLGASVPAPYEYYRGLFWPLGPALRRVRQRMPIDTPTLYLHGAHDGCISPRMAAGQERYFRARFEAHIVESVGHFLQLEDPARVGGLIADWLGPAR